MSIFWMDLRYRLRNQKKVPLQDSRGVTGTSPVFVFVILYILPGLLYMLHDYLAVVPSLVPGV